MELKSIGVTENKAKQFEKRGIFTVEDLVAYLPTGYKDFTKETGIRLTEGETSCIVVKTTKIHSYQGGRVPVVSVDASVVAPNTPDDGQHICITWFGQQFMYRKLLPEIGLAFYLAGKVTWDGKYAMYKVNSPDLFEPLSQDVRRIYPTYKKVPGMSMDYLTEKMTAAMGMPDATAETLPVTVVQEYRLLSRKEALYQLHHPASMAQVQAGQDRILFDELLYFALHNEWAKRASVPVSPVMLMNTPKMQEVINSLPYKLTEDQQKVLMDMLNDAKDNRRINALLQGDVGCGKTIVAILLMVAMAENGYQSVLMAPTQVLARQHYDTLAPMAEKFGFKAVYLGSELTAKEKKAVKAEIASGAADFVVGTHSVIAPSVTYKKLALTITDEEHKFGVAQRTALVNKAADGVHTITMSATPIPRTLAQVIYGTGLQLYTIHTMPEGRKPVITGLASTRQKLLNFIVREAKAGHQTYVVCPLIDPSDKLEGVKSVEEVRKEYEDALGPLGIRIATLTGKDSKATTNETIDKLKNGEIDVLIATSVVEVGVNIPTATMMVVSNAERFGLASLHQLRGRVGRSSLQSYCVLDCSRAADNGKSEKRLSAMCSTNDGFKIAQSDLAIRGAGDFLGTKQSGESKSMTLMMAFPEKYKEAQRIAEDLLDRGTPCKMMDQVREERRNLG